MKRICLLMLCFLLFIVAYGCAKGDDASAPGSFESSESSATSSSESANSTESGEDASSEDEIVSSGDESSNDTENSYENSDESSEPSDENQVSTDESNPETSKDESDDASEPTPDESSDDTSTDTSTDTSEDTSNDEESSQPPVDEPTEPPIDEPVEPPIDEPTEPPIDEPDEPDNPPVDEPDNPPVDEPVVPPVSEPDENKVNPKIPPNYKEDEDMTTIGDAELLPTGYILYNNAAYHATSYKADVAQAYADTYARYAELFPDVRISVVMPPQSSINIKNPLVRAMVANQGDVLDKTASHVYGNVNFVNLRSIFESTRGEYCYFRSDYHWTQLGAYYAYSEFASSIGLTPTKLDDFEVKVVTENFIGRAYDTSGDARVNSYTDVIYAFMPRKTHTMTVHNSDLSVNRVFNNCIYTSRESYSCFINGDNPYTVINVPSNDQDKVALVIKESSGNAFVPFLTEHYGTIIVIDPRHININIKNLVAEKGVDDIIFHATSSTCSRIAYNDYYRDLIAGA